MLENILGILKADGIKNYSGNNKLILQMNETILRIKYLHEQNYLHEGDN